MIVSQILKSKASDAILSVTPGSPVSEAADLLARNKIGSVVVSSDGRTAAGILSERDIVRALSTVGAEALARPVDDYMTSRVVTCDPDETADAVLATMTDGRFRHMPVVSDGVMVGLITLGDVVKARLSELSMEKDALESMIMGH